METPPPERRWRLDNVADSGGPHFVSVLAQPSVVRGQGQAAVDRQLQAWRELSDEDRIYQLCYAQSEADR